MLRRLYALAAPLAFILLLASGCVGTGETAVVTTRPEVQDTVVARLPAIPERADPLDTIRAGRFDRRVTVHLPSADDRREILKIHARGKPLADDVDLDRVARGTPGFSGADLENLLNEAALLAARKDRDAIHRAEIEEARDKTMMGLERKGIELSDKELEMIAYHEAGHAVVAAAMPEAEPIHKVSVIPRGRAMGVTQQLPEKERFLYQREYMLDRLAVMMGGRAAEDLVFDTATSGAENDLKEATKLVRKMVVDWGMSDAFTNVAMGSGQKEVFIGQQMGKQRDYSEATAQRIDEEGVVPEGHVDFRVAGVLAAAEHRVDEVAILARRVEPVRREPDHQRARLQGLERVLQPPRRAIEVEGIERLGEVEVRVGIEPVGEALALIT